MGQRALKALADHCPIGVHMVDAPDLEQGPPEETQADPAPGAKQSLMTGLRGTVYRKR